MTGSVHDIIADLLGDCGEQIVVDLGAGSVGTLPSLASTGAGLRLALAVDDRLSTLADRDASMPRLAADLATDLPFSDASIDVVVSHNTLECLRDPERLIRDIHRVLRPGGTAVLAHTDFETIVLVADDRQLSRRVCLSYADLPVLYEGMATADPHMGRRLAGLVRGSQLDLVTVAAHVTVATEYAGKARERVEEMATSVRRSARRGLADVPESEVDHWLEDLARQHSGGKFFFSETAYVVQDRRSQVAD